MRPLLWHALILTLTLILFAPCALAQTPPSAAEVTAHLDTLYRTDSSHHTLRMEIKPSRWERTLKLEAWSRGEDDALIVIRAPAREAGTATLHTTKGLWNYAPRADRLVRIPSGMLGDSWMGSHFTNDDLVRETSWEDDYNTTTAFVDEGGTRVLRLTSHPKPNAAVVYSRVEQILTADTWLPIRAEFYDDDNALVRTMHYRDVKTMDGRTLPTILEVIPADKSNEHTRVVYEKMAFNTRVSKSMFTPVGLRRAAQR